MITKWKIAKYKELENIEIELAPISIFKEDNNGFNNTFFRTFSSLLHSSRKTKDTSIYNKNDIIEFPMELYFTITPEKDEQIEVKLISKQYNNNLMFASSFRLDYKTKDGKEYYIQNNPVDFSKDLLEEITGNNIFNKYKKYADIDFNTPGIVRDNILFLPGGITYTYKYNKYAIDDFISLMLQIPDLPLKNHGCAKKHVREMLLFTSLDKELINHFLYLALNSRPNLFKFGYTNYFYDLFENYLVEDECDNEFLYYDIELEDWYMELSKLEKEHKDTILNYIRTDFYNNFHDMLMKCPRFTKPCELPGQLKKAVDFLSTYLASENNKAVKIDYLPFSSLAQGETQLSRLYKSSMNSLSGSTIIVENPEINLKDENLTTLANWLLDRAEYGHQFILWSNTDVLINKLNKDKRFKKLGRVFAA